MAVTVAGDVTGKDNVGVEQYLRREKQDPVIDKSCECKGQYVGEDFAVVSGGMTFLTIQDAVITQNERLADLEVDFDLRVTDLEISSTEFESSFEAHGERIDSLETQNARIESLETCCTGHALRMDVLEMKVNALQQGINICGPWNGFAGYHASSKMWEHATFSPLECIQDCERNSDGIIGMYFWFGWGGSCYCLGPTTDEASPYFGLTCLTIDSSRLKPPPASPYPEGTYYLLPNSFSDVCPSKWGLFGPGCE